MYTHALELVHMHACTHTQYTHTLYSRFVLSMNISESNNISEVPQDQVQLLSDLLAHQSSLALLSDSTPPLGPRRKGIFCIICHSHPCSSVLTLLMFSHGSRFSMGTASRKPSSAPSKLELENGYLPIMHTPLPFCRMNLCHLSEVLI